MAEEFTDWRGNPVRPGDTVLYPSMHGRSCQITEGVLLDLWRAGRVDYKWKRLKVGEPAPTKLVWEHVRDADGKPVLEDGVYARHQVEQSDFEWRAKIQPTADSRFTRYSTQGDWDPSTRTYEELIAKPVTLTIVQNLTLLAPAQAEAS